MASINIAETSSTNADVTAYITSAKLPGTIGLNNLGNTSFMNSVLQCLAHSPELVEYFLTGFYQKELDLTNPFDMKGTIAEVFGSLLHKLWHPISYAVAPRQFKLQLEKFAPQFNIYAQNDAQEFLAFLLDTLHEDLNRVLKKPNVEMPDWNGGDDKDLVRHAITAWEGYKKQNDSLIVDLFQGQYKSTLVCPRCEKVSITFEPFMSLTLPLPVQRSWEHIVYWVPYDITKPHVKIPVQLLHDGSIHDLKLLMKKWMGAPVENQICIEVFNHEIYKEFTDHKPLSEFAERDVIVLYELPCAVNSTRAKDDDSATHVVLPVYHSNKTASSSHSHDLFGIPIYMAIPIEDSRSEEAIYASLVQRYSPWTLQPDHLYKRIIAIAESAAPSGKYPLDTSENEELGVSMEIGDLYHDILPESRELSEAGEETITNLGPKDNLFTIKVYGPVYSGGYSYSAGLLSDPLRGVGETLAERTTFTKKKSSSTFKWSQYSAPEPPALPNSKRELITSGDSVVCEWEPDLLEFFFGITPSKGHKKEEKSHWEQWDTFEHPEYLSAVKTKKAIKERGITLDDCLDEFVKEQRLSGDDLWYCPRCKNSQQAMKKFGLWKVPDILVIHLKRFSNSRLLRGEIDSMVDFPVEGLDLTARVEERLVAKKWMQEGHDLESLGISDASIREPLLYDLYAVDEHIGGPGEGHYRAYAKNFEDDTWYHFDDSRVMFSEPKASVNRNAYLLFYRRRAQKPLCPRLEGVQIRKHVFGGPYSNIYLGKWENNAVGIKIINSVPGKDLGGMKKKLDRELETWWMLKHPRIALLHGFADSFANFESDFGGMVSQWYQNGNAHNFLQKQSFTFEERMNLWLEVIEAVVYLHGHYPVIVHGDLKPGNVLIDDEGHARLCDFGLVRLIAEYKTESTTSSSFSGTVRYLSKELCTPSSDRGPTPSSDIHAVGCIGLEFLYSITPYKEHVNNFAGQITMDIRNGRPPAERPSGLSEYDEACWDVFELCWAIDPQARPSAPELFDLVQQLRSFD